MESERSALPGVLLVFKIIFFVIASWLLLHLFAVAGPFVAFAFPIWWIFFPESVPCILCRVKEPGDYCFFCGREVTPGRSIGFRSVLFNMAFVLLVFLVSLGFVFLEIRILREFGIPSTPKTVSFVIPPKGQYRLGEVFPMEISMQGIKTPVNAVQADFTFDPRRLEIVEISTHASFANIFLQKEIDNEQGFGRLTGGLPNPGFSADHGVFGIVYFRGKMPGIAQVEFLPSSMVLANDGSGTNVLKGFATSSYLILPEEVADTEKERQEVIMFSEILGAKEEQKEQMLFFEESEVLGEQIAESAVEQGRFRIRIGEILLRILHSIDKAIISLWCKACLSTIDFRVFVGR